MNKPVVYIKYSKLAQTEADSVLNKTKELFTAKNYSVLDVGCGPGNVTCEKILPLLYKTTTKVIGVDVSYDNIEYAKKHYEVNPRVTFQQMDILTNAIPTEYLGSFDLITSLFCFHLVGDHRKALTNIHTMLKPRGKILISLMGKSVLAPTYESLRKNPKWTKYMPNFANVVPIPQSKQSLTSLCEEVGFSHVKCEEESKNIPQAEDTLFTMFKVLNLFDVPNSLEDDFINDHVEYITKEGCVTVDPDGKKRFNFPYTVLIITADK